MAAQPPRERGAPGAGEGTGRLLARSPSPAAAVEPVDRRPLPAAPRRQQRSPLAGSVVVAHPRRRAHGGLGLRRQGLVPLPLSDGPGADRAHRHARAPGQHGPCGSPQPHHPVDVPHDHGGRAGAQRLCVLPDHLLRHRCGTRLLAQPDRQTWSGLGLVLLSGLGAGVLPVDGADRRGLRPARASAGVSALRPLGPGSRPGRADLAAPAPPRIPAPVADGAPGAHRRRLALGAPLARC